MLLENRSDKADDRTIDAMPQEAASSPLMRTCATRPPKRSNVAASLWRGEPMSALGYERSSLVGSEKPGRTMSFQPIRRSE